MKRICTVEGCGNVHRANGLCMGHYMEKWRKSHREHIALYDKKTFDKRSKQAVVRSKANSEKFKAASKKWREENTTYLAEYYKKRAKELIARAVKRYAADPAKYRAYAKRHREADPERKKAWDDAWRKANPAKVTANHANRRAAQCNAMAPWANKFLVDGIYAIAALATKRTGLKWEVDHIVPLIHPLVCGLHVEKNLQVITKSANSAKGNHWWPDMPT